jgi:shikimate dehydrogenase
MHRAAYAELGLDGWSYEAIECAEAGLPGLLERCGPDWAGLSLTMPLKRAVLPLLDDTDPVAELTGGANTVVFRDGARHGYNTDVAGLVTALTEAGLDRAGRGVSPADAVILGAGATACSALAALDELGVHRVAVAVRDPARAVDLVAVAGRLSVAVSLHPYGEKNLGDGAELVLSTVPGAGADPYAGQLGMLARPPRIVMDVVYHPWPTALAAAAQAAGLVTVGGFEMLLHQAARQVELMTGHPAPVQAMRMAGQEALTSNNLTSK